MNGDIITDPRQSMRRNSCAIKFSATSLCETLETSVLSVSQLYGIIRSAMLVENYENMGMNAK